MQGIHKCGLPQSDPYSSVHDVCWQALQLAESFTSQETRQMMQALALQNQRCLPLLRALSYYLAQNRSELHVDTIVDLLFACGEWVP